MSKIQSITAREIQDSRGKPTVEVELFIEGGTRALSALSARPSTNFELGALVVKAAPKGCKDCNFTGYRGRKGLFEVLLVDNNMERFILTNPPVSAIQELAIKKGMVTIWQSGLIEVVQGITTLEEVKKVVEAGE